jgi:nicotinic acid phosphoribosyltransferase
MFHIAAPKEIKEGKLADVYFVRTMEVLKAKKIDKWVKAEFIAKRFPEDYEWGGIGRSRRSGLPLERPESQCQSDERGDDLSGL